MTAPTPADAEARDLIKTALDETLVVEAAAGTGKTTALVERMLRVLASGRATIGALVAVTFTEKAAGELKLRLREELERARVDESRFDAASRLRLEEALGHLEEANIGTIHGFCADLLRERPIEAGVDPLFAVLTDAQARRLFDEAFGGWFEHALEEMPEGIRRSLRRSARPDASGEADRGGPIDRLKRAGWDLAEWRDFPAAWTRPHFDRRAQVDSLTAVLKSFADATSRPTSVRDAFYAGTAAARRTSDELRLLQETDDLDGAEALLVDLARDRDFRRPRKGYGTAYSPAVARADLAAQHQALMAGLDAFRADADADLAASVQSVLRGSVAAYEALKAKAGALDFLDLLVRARDLVRDHDRVRRDFQARFARLFVDEFQDTDPLQAELLVLLASSDPDERQWTRAVPTPGKLFIVGDPKQSIYRFRRADVGIYQRVVTQLTTAGARHVVLSTSFRSVPNLQAAVNAAFGVRMREDADTLQAGYIPLEPWRTALGDQPSVVALPVPRPYGMRRISQAAIERSLPDAVGALIEWILRDSGWQVTDRNGDPRGVRPGDVCVLFRRFVSFGTDVTRPYLDAFEARGITHVLVGGRAFHDREEIETLRAALAAIEWPDDELSVFATLRGALFGIGDEPLLEYRHRFPRGLHPFRLPPDLPERLAPIGEALGQLARWHVGRNRRPVAETVTDLLAATRAHVGFALRRGGEQVLANALHVAELARQYERSDGLSFRGFVEALREAAAAGDAPDAPIVEEGGDGVRLMTVHKAKGLEFPVVVLADITAKLATPDPSRHLDAEKGLCALRIGGWSPWDLVHQQAIEQARDVEEGVRLSYVAATRARDVLVVPVVGDDEFPGGWVSPLNVALYPPVGARRTAEVVATLPTFSRDSVLERPDGALADGHTVSPGRHRFVDERHGGTHDVVWWDPGALSLDAPPPVGLRRHEIIARDVSEDVVGVGLDRHRAWAEARAATLARASVPSVRVITTTQWAAGEDAPAELALEGWSDPVEVVALPHRGVRPAGPRFGTLVHAVLANIRLADEQPDLLSVASTQARIVGATADEEAAAIVVVAGVVDHVVWKDARRAEQAGLPSRVWRETPVTLHVAGTILEGVVDLAYQRDEVVTVVDFKTDRAVAPALDRYTRQVAAYARAFGRATGKPTRAILLQV